MKNIIIALTVSIVATSCVEVLFEQAQPSGGKELKEFPESLQGMYIGESDNDTLIITPVELQGAKEERDSTMKISSGFVLKKFKGVYIVSRKHNTGLWEVAFMEADKNNRLIIKTMDGDDEEKMKLLRELVKVTVKYDEDGKVDHYLLNPTKRELKKIIKKDVFEELGVFRKVE